VDRRDRDAGTLAGISSSSSPESSISTARSLRARPGGGFVFFAGLFRAGVVFALLLFAVAAVAALALRFAPRDPAVRIS
jgi:hypothetical protein